MLRLRRRGVLGGLFTPASLFSASQQGVWYDPTDLSTMFQDAAGTTPVTALNDPVGLILDKSGNGKHASQSTSGSRPTYAADANGKVGLKFDGVDDYLVTSSIDFSASDKMFVCAGVRKLSSASIGLVAELSQVASLNGAFYLVAPRNAGTGNYGWRSSGTKDRDATSPDSYPIPISNVLTGIGDISGDVARLRVNGSQVAENTDDQGTGAYGNYPLYIGRRGGSSLPFNGFIHQLVVRGGSLPDAATITQTETYVNQRAGAY